ncbi:MAG: nicotinate-nucleotide diphosphorylase (carboxylating), partial [Deltaproteobacteria bacterium]|nr:nicotinate-nucleotide diphosphorylase (carboxylating) [Deltaproteobacteria bacterium]
MFSTEKLIKMALEEDLGPGDITTLSTIPPGTVARALVKSKQDCVAAGLQVLGLVFRTLDPSLKIEARAADGENLKVGSPLMAITGNVISILMAERTGLNFVQRLCGIATLTSRYVAAVDGFRAEIVDTR